MYTLLDLVPSPSVIRTVSQASRTVGLVISHRVQNTERLMRARTCQAHTRVYLCICRLTQGGWYSDHGLHSPRQIELISAN